MSESPDPFRETFRPWVERNGFAHWTVALAWLIIAFILFQVLAGIIAVIFVLSRSGPDIEPTQAMDMLMQNLDLVFIGNTVGQVIFLGLCTWFVSRMHTSKWERPSFLRFNWREDTLYMSGLTVLLIIAIQPGIWFLSWLNGLIPVPEFFESMQSSQMEMIEAFLRGDHLIWLTLLHVALVPAVCEEVLFRGYVLRAFEKSWSIWPAIILSGILFGLYHLQLTNLLPLLSIGILLAFLTWISGSIVPAMVAHFVNNGSSVLLGSLYPDSALAELTPGTLPPLWAVILSVAVSAYIIYLMSNQHKEIGSGEPVSHV